MWKLTSTIYGRSPRFLGAKNRRLGMTFYKEGYSFGRPKCVIPRGRGPRGIGNVWKLTSTICGSSPRFLGAKDRRLGMTPAVCHPEGP